MENKDKYTLLIERVKKNTGIDTISVSITPNGIIVDDTSIPTCLVQVGVLYDAMHVAFGDNTKVGITDQDMVDFGFLEPIDKPLITGFDELDNMLSGGIPAGQMACIGPIRSRMRMERFFKYGRAYGSMFNMHPKPNNVIRILISSSDGKVSTKMSKVRRHLYSLWFKKDFNSFLDYIYHIGLMDKTKDGYFKDGIYYLKPTDKLLWLSTFWNRRNDIKHTKGSYDNWNPYCGRIWDIPTERYKQCSWPRMTKENYGWRCPECGNVIGKHLHRINLKLSFTDEWLKSKIEDAKTEKSYYSDYMNIWHNPITQPNAIAKVSLT
jgi:hypothetical protein